jgi:hypothetical protein
MGGKAGAAALAVRYLDGVSLLKPGSNLPAVHPRMHSIKR